MSDDFAVVRKAIRFPHVAGSYDDLAWVALDRIEARLKAAEREVDAQMQAKLDAQSLLANITEALDIDRSTFNLNETWGSVAESILARLNEIVDAGITVKAERDKARADAGRLAEALLPLAAFQDAGYLAGHPFEETYALLVKAARAALAAHEGRKDAGAG